MNSDEPMIRLEDAGDEARIESVRRLFRSYSDEFASSIGKILNVQGFEAELAGLPGRYAPPSGSLILATAAGVAAGCVGLRDVGDGACEMKRLYVVPEYRGRSLGIMLVEELLRRAGRMGYRRMILDSVPEMVGAIALYRRYGFVEIAPPPDHPPGHDVFMEKILNFEKSEEIRRMENPGFAEVVQEDMAAYVEHLAARIERLARMLSDEELWAKPFGFGNSVGRIVVHLTGSLSHYIGAKVAGTGYVRDRADEFANPSNPPTDKLFHDFHEAIGMMVGTLRSQGEPGLTTSVNDCGDPVRDRFGLFLVCTAHMSNHVGQIVYLVQALGRPLDEKVW